jgi:hypothetical protein
MMVTLRELKNEMSDVLIISRRISRTKQLSKELRGLKETTWGHFDSRGELICA